MNYSAVTGGMGGHYVITAATQSTTLVVSGAVPTSVTTGGRLTSGFTGGSGANALTKRLLL